MDILQDQGYIRLLSIKTAHPGLVPEYVDSADLAEIKTASAQLSINEFANDISRELPLGDKAQIWLAAAYFTKSAKDLQYGPDMREYIWGRIKEAAEVYGILDEVEKVAAVLGEEKRAEAEEHWGFVSGEDRRYPLHDADLVKKAVDYFGRNRDKYPFHMRREIAGNIYKRACTLKLETSDTVRKEAGVGYPDRFAVIDAIEDRTQRIASAFPALAEKLAGYSDAVKLASPNELMEATDAVAEVMELVDKTAGFRYAGKGPAGSVVERPVDLMYSISPKTAQEDSQRFVKLARYTFDCVKLANAVDPEQYDIPLGDDFLRNAIPKVAGFEDMQDSAILFHVLQALPDTDKAALEQHLKTL
jgi:hypothetical protein